MKGRGVLPADGKWLPLNVPKRELRHAPIGSSKKNIPLRSCRQGDSPTKPKTGRHCRSNGVAAISSMAPTRTTPSSRSAARTRTVAHIHSEARQSIRRNPGHHSREASVRDAVRDVVRGFLLCGFGAGGAGSAATAAVSLNV